VAAVLSRVRADRGLLLRAGLAAAFVVAAVSGPLWGDRYTVYLLTQGFLYAALAVTLDLVWGRTGILDLGHAVWFGAGALAVGVLTTTLSPDGLVVAVHGGLGTYILAALLAMVAAGVAAAVIGLYCFSWRGSTMFTVAIVTLALSVVCEALYLELHWTGGDNGLFGFRLGALDTTAWFYVCLAFLGVVLAGAWLVARSDLGVLLRAIRDNESRARDLGFPVDRVKIGVLAGGAAGAALTGAFYGALIGLVSSPLFGFLFSTQIVVWVAIGGRGTLIGPALGAIALQFATSSLDRTYPDQWQLIVGLAFIAVVVFVPDGVAPPVWRLLRRAVAGPGRPPSGLRLTPSATPAGHPAQGPAAKIEDLRFGYGALRVLRGLSLEVRRAELLCVIGPNGAGKSTLLSVMADGRLRHQGTVSYAGAPRLAHRGAPVDALARAGVLRKPQTPSLFKGLTAGETILLASRRGRVPSPFRRTTEVAVPVPVVALCQATGLDRHLDEPGTALAHGLKQALELAATIAAWPEVLLLDEPTAGLTAHERALVGDVLRGLVREHERTVVLIEHDLDFVDGLADRIVVLRDGTVLAVGSTAEIRRDESVREGYLGVTGATA
jgi:branched-chain amino acid transport system permease protein